MVGTPEFKVGNVNMPTHRLGLDIAYLYTKFDGLSFSFPRHMIGAPKIFNF